jgi:hypothetical protein
MQNKSQVNNKMVSIKILYSLLFYNTFAVNIAPHRRIFKVKFFNYISPE